MIPLDSPRWRELRQAYGSAEDIPRLLEHLPLVDDDGRRELWLGLWGTLCRRGDVYDASYAAVPHLVAFAATRPAAERARALHLVGAVEVGRRLAPGAPPLSPDLADAYHAALAEVPALVAGCAGEEWDADTAQVLAATIAIAKGYPRMGNVALHIEPMMSCPVCGAAHPPPGWEPERR